jgi:Chaperone of endosialidase
MLPASSSMLPTSSRSPITLLPSPTTTVGILHGNPPSRPITGSSPPITLANGTGLTSTGHSGGAVHPIAIVRQPVEVSSLGPTVRPATVIIGNNQPTVSMPSGPGQHLTGTVLHNTVVNVHTPTTPTVHTTTVTVNTPTVNVHTPTVRTPTVSTPTVRTPTVNVVTPKVNVPNVHVSTITVRTPTVNVPTVRTPTVRVNVPTVRTPSVSDIRLKEEIVELGTMASGLHLYSFRYIGAPMRFVGVMAQDVAITNPDAVIMGDDGYLRVDYERLGLKFMSYREWLSLPVSERGVQMTSGD